MTCTHKCTPLSARCGWNCFDLSTQTSENGPRLNEEEKDGYSLLCKGKANSGRNKGIGDRNGRV